MARKKGIPFNVIFTEDQHKQLTALSETMQISKGGVIRAAIIALHKHRIEKFPTCADGHGCFVPHMHAR